MYIDVFRIAVIRWLISELNDVLDVVFPIQRQITC